jgi:hypothetical protein
MSENNVQQVEASPTEVPLSRLKGRDIWLRARINAFAHKHAASKASVLSGVFFVVQTVFIVIPIICVSLSLQFATAGGPAKTSSISPILGVVSIVSNGIGLGAMIVAERFHWGETRAQHANLMSGYQMIAQKARRLDNAGLPQAEVVHLCRHLEESFETLKSSGLEPSDRDHDFGYRMLLRLPNYPFGITRQDVLQGGESARPPSPRSSASVAA